MVDFVRTCYATLQDGCLALRSGLLGLRSGYAHFTRELSAPHQRKNPTYHGDNPHVLRTTSGKHDPPSLKLFKRSDQWPCWESHAQILFLSPCILNSYVVVVHSDDRHEYQPRLHILDTSRHITGDNFGTRTYLSVTYDVAHFLRFTLGPCGYIPSPNKPMTTSFYSDPSQRVLAFEAGRTGNTPSKFKLNNSVSPATHGSLDIGCIAPRPALRLTIGHVTCRYMTSVMQGMPSTSTLDGTCEGRGSGPAGNLAEKTVQKRFS